MAAELENEDNDIEIEIEDLSADEEVGETGNFKESAEDSKARSNEMDEYGKRVQKRISELTFKAEEAKREAVEALKKVKEADDYAQNVFEENQRLKQTLEWGRGEYINEFSAKLNAAQELAEQTYRQAYEAGDSDKMIQAQRAFSEIAVQRSRLASMPAPSAPEEEPKYEKPLTKAAKAETIAPEVSYEEPPTEFADPRTEEWHTRNSWFGQDKDMTALTMGVHGRLIEQGVEPASSEYFTAIDKEVRLRFPEKFNKPRKTSPVAPAGRTTATRKVSLTPTEVARANKYGIPLERFAAEKAKLMESN
jgi:hypothetical protein